MELVLSTYALSTLNVYQSSVLPSWSTGSRVVCFSWDRPLKKDGLRAGRLLFRLQHASMSSDRLSPERVIGMFPDGDIWMRDGLKARLTLVYVAGLQI